MRLMLELGLSLQRIGWRVTVVCHDHEPDAEFAHAARALDIRSVRTGSEEWSLSRSRMIERYWRGMARVSRLVPGDADVVNAHEWPGSHAGRLAARRLNVPLVWTRNDETGWERAIVPDQTIISSRNPGVRAMRAALGWPDLRDARAASAIVVLSSPQARMVERSYRRPAQVVPHGPAAAFFEAPDRREARGRLRVGDGEFLAVGAAILFPHRRFEDLVEAMALVDEPDARALILGSDHADSAYADRLERLIRTRGLQQRVRLPRANFSDAELRDAYAAADVFVYPNQRQTWGLVPLEALAAGTPVIVSSGAGVSEILRDRAGVRIVPPEQPSAIAAAIRATRADPGREGVGRTREWLRRELSTDRYAEQMATIYEEELR